MSVKPNDVFTCTIFSRNSEHRQVVDTAIIRTCMRGSRGGVGGIPQLEFAKLNIADITGNEKKLVIFHICALPQLYVKVGPPGKIFWIRA